MKISGACARAPLTRPAIVALSLCCLMAASAPAAAQRESAPNGRESGIIFMGTVLYSVAPRVTVAESPAAPKTPRGSRASDRARRFLAFTAEGPDLGQGSRERIFFTDVRRGRTFEIRGLPDPHRPFDDLVFTRGGLLQFDRWSNPHYGVRYRLDVRRRKLVSARAFVEAAYAEARRKSQRR